MKKNLNNITFIFSIILIILSTLFINFNIKRIIPDYKGIFFESDIEQTNSSQYVSIRSKIYSELNNLKLSRSITDFNNDDELLQQCIKAFNLDDYKTELLTFYEAPIKNIENSEDVENSFRYFSFSKYNKDNYLMQNQLFYKKDYSKVYYCSYKYMNSAISHKTEQIDTELKKEIAKECTKVTQNCGISVLSSFKPNKIWRSENGYSLEDSDNNITIFYDYSSKEIIAFSFEKL